MNSDEYNEYCKSLPVTVYVVQLGGSNAWKVGGRVLQLAAETMESIPV